MLSTSKEGKDEDDETPKYIWMAGPLIHFVTAGLTYYDVRLDSGNYWGAVLGWNILSGYTTILWYHEYWVTGPNLEDLWNTINLVSWVITVILSGLAVYDDDKDAADSHPAAFTANIVGSAFGVLLSLLTYRFKKNQTLD